VITKLRLVCWIVAAATVLSVTAILPAGAQQRSTDRRSLGPQAATTPPVEREILVVNRSRRVINEVYVSATEADNWGEDRLSDGVLQPGGSLRVRLGRTRDCGFDIQVVYDDGAREEASGQNVCRTRQLAFDGARAVAAPIPAMPAHVVVLHNGSHRTIQQVFVSSADAQQWGVDVLEDGPIAVGAQATVSYRGHCVSDLRVVFDNHAAEERRGLDLCRLPEMSIEPGWTTTDEVLVPRAGLVPLPQVLKMGDAPPVYRLQVENRSGSALVELYVFASDSAGPGMDLLGGLVVADGSDAAVAVPGRPACRFSSRAVMKGPRPDKEIAGIDLCTAPTLVLSP
jgi:hypothetical protein